MGRRRRATWWGSRGLAGRCASGARAARRGPRRRRRARWARRDARSRRARAPRGATRSRGARRRSRRWWTRAIGDPTTSPRASRRRDEPPGRDDARRRARDAARERAHRARARRHETHVPRVPFEPRVGRGRAGRCGAPASHADAHRHGRSAPGFARRRGNGNRDAVGRLWTRSLKSGLRPHPLADRDPADARVRLASFRVPRLRFGGNRRHER